MMEKMRYRNCLFFIVVYYKSYVVVYSPSYVYSLVWCTTYMKEMRLILRYLNTRGDGHGKLEGISEVS
jgi:hypothetical protein